MTVVSSERYKPKGLGIGGIQHTAGCKGFTGSDLKLWTKEGEFGGTFH